jgi:propanol-preferring alcohol dehydrogenase
MKAAVLKEFVAPLVLEDRPEPEPRGEEVVVRVLGAGVCHTDLHIVDDAEERYELPLVLGHEIAGGDEELGPVLVYGAWGCGSCRFCRRGEEQLCADAVSPGFERDGGYEERVLVPSRRYLLPLEGIDPVRAAPLADAGATPLRAVRRVAGRLDRDATVLVVGAGGLGQFAIQYVKLLSDAKVLAVDTDERKRARAVDLGADAALPPEAVDHPVRVALDFVGSAATLELAARVVEPAGAIIVVGAARGSIPFGMTLVPWEAELSVSLWASLDDVAATLELARRDELRWHVEALPLEQANEALDRLRRGDTTGRLVLVP